MIPRYTLPEMGAVWGDQARFEAMLRVEIAVLHALVAQGAVPAAAVQAIETRGRVDVERIAELERTTDHDVIAFVSQVAETVGEEGRWLHFGLTSSDVVDTGLALQCRAAGELLLAQLDATIATLADRAREHAQTRMMGRTHSVHAEPITFGLKLATWAFELHRARTRLLAATDDIATGKISGPVGTYSQLGPDIEEAALGELGLHADPVSTQIVQRDRHAAFLAAIAVTGGSIERFATEVRNLQHTEIAEVQEPFRAGQKGSSAMPHKRNPITAERLSGLARLLRGYALAGMEDQALWHERDISHSSVERVALPGATTLLHYMLVRFRGVVDGLVVRTDRMAENIERGLGLHASSRLLTALVEDAGLSREDAYAIVQGAALRAADERVPFRDLVAADPVVAATLAPEQLAAAFDDARTLRHVAAILARLDAIAPTRGAPDPAGSATFLRSGKVRDLYLVDAQRLLLVASDRLSAFDVVLPTPIPDKGRVLTGLTRYWLTHTPDLVPDHLLGTDPAALPADLLEGLGLEPDELRGRMMLCRRVEPLPAELVVRGYLAGGGWAEYRRDGTVSGVRLPDGLREADRLATPVFTPSTKAQAGHDEPIAFDALVALVGPLVAERARHVALAVYERGAAIASRGGLLLADTKIELGIAPRDPADDSPDDDASRAARLMLIDEVLTPDSSRFWDASAFEPGGPQASFDKQYVRDWLIASGWDRTPPGPELPDAVVEGTRARYVDAFERLTGARFAAYVATDRIATPAGARA